VTERMGFGNANTHTLVQLVFLKNQKKTRDTRRGVQEGGFRAAQPRSTPVDTHHPNALTRHFSAASSSSPRSMTIIRHDSHEASSSEDSFSATSVAALTRWLLRLLALLLLRGDREDDEVDEVLRRAAVGTRMPARVEETAQEDDIVRMDGCS
jgi:hypothetical protein